MCQLEILPESLIFLQFSEVVALSAQDMLHRNFDVRRQHNNF